MFRFNDMMLTVMAALYVVFFIKFDYFIMWFVYDSVGVGGGG